MSGKYIPVIGLEVHVELATESKMFCRCKNDPFHAGSPNIYTCPVCLGMPGALPVPNQKAVEWTLQLAGALGCEINKFSKFDRKHYFYPDLPKGYQISQYDLPFGYEGSLRGVRIRRVHLEEDTGKLVHQSVDGEDLSLVDFNRSGVPLVEIVTEPDFRSSEQVMNFAKELRRIVRFLDLSVGDMEKGTMRLEANVSLATEEPKADGSNLPNFKVELKNINSFRFMGAAIECEFGRQRDLLEKGERVAQETRGWDENRRETVVQRSKEEANDYRYFPEPDIPPIVLNQSEVSRILAVTKKLPEYYDSLFESRGISVEIVEVLASDRRIAVELEKVFAEMDDVMEFVKWFVHKKVELSRKVDYKSWLVLFQKEIGGRVGDSEQIESWVREVIDENEAAVKQYTGGKKEVMGFLVGMVQAKARGKADGAKVRLSLEKKLG